MPPRKRVKVAAAASPTPTPQPKTPTPAASPSAKSLNEQPLDDPWTDEEEIGLFKGMMQWKPTGMRLPLSSMSVEHALIEEASG